MKFIASVSFGKDSLAMLILLMKFGLPLDEVVFFDTGMEFDEVYEVRDGILPALKTRGITYTELKPKRPFIETMLNYPHLSRSGEMKSGYGWCGGLCRWGTTEKLRAIEEYCKGSIQYVGIAKDETARLDRLRRYPNKRAPLATFGYTEKDALELCYRVGYRWGGLYEYLDRVSCWCCRNKNLKELANIKKHLPKYFDRLVALEKEIGEPMKKPKTLPERFNEKKPETQTINELKEKINE